MLNRILRFLFLMRFRYHIAYIMLGVRYLNVVFKVKKNPKTIFGFL